MKIFITLLFILQLFVSAHADCCSQDQSVDCHSTEIEMKNSEQMTSKSASTKESERKTESAECASQCLLKKFYLTKMTLSSTPLLSEEIFSYWFFQSLASQATPSVILEPPIKA